MDRGRGRTPHSRGRNSPIRRSQRANDQSKHPHNPVVGDGFSGSKSCSGKDGRKSYWQNSGRSFSLCHGSQASHYCEQSSSSSCEGDDESVKVTTCQLEQRVPDTSSSCSEELDRETASKLVVKSDAELPSRQGDPVEHLQSRNPTIVHKTVETENPALVEPFDICRPKESGLVSLKVSLLVRNREKRNETKRNMGTTSRTVLRPGMMLLKGYISSSDQVKIVERCRQLGLGPGGFYQPAYREGTKLHLKMMCLGKNWDPQTSEYGDRRPFDGARPPNIPAEFLQITEQAIRDSQALIQQDSKTGNPEKTLPSMEPDICLVNFYSQNGRLGLHRDKDESEESLRRGLPVVSFSIGDSADFLFGDERDPDKAQKVVLESGDVLIFGGKSRDIFHGVTVIHPNTAPKLLLQETNLRPGRLNITLRQY